MSRIHWAGFLGENRRNDPLQLVDGVGTISRNQKPGRGDLRPWRAPLTVASVPVGSGTIYRMGRDVQADSQYWLAWPGVVHVMRSFSVSDTTERTFYTGDGGPKVTDNTIALAGAPYPTASRPMGLPVPVSACTVTTIDGAFTGDQTEYYYVYTYVNDWGWESAPSPPSISNIRASDAPATLAAFAAPPAGNYNINLIRIYRTQADEVGNGEYYFLRDVALGSSTTDDNRALGRVMSVLGWFPPPEDLTFLTPLWNGMAAGISAGAVNISEQYAEYAWKVENDIVPPDGKVIALGVFEQSLLILTTGQHAIATGTSPDNFDQIPLGFTQGCVSPESVVSMGYGVVWASNDGLCWYGSAGASVITKDIMTREDWLKLDPSSIRGSMYQGHYFGSYDDGSGRKAFIVDPRNPMGMYFLDYAIETMHFDKLQDQMYVLSGGSVQRWDAGDTLMDLTARSRLFRIAAPDSMGVCEVVSNEFPMTVVVDALRLDPNIVSRTQDRRPGIFTAPDATTLRYTFTVNSEGVYNLPSIVSNYWQIEVQGVKALSALVLASEPKELVEQPA